jgi:hypothetical protein
MSGNAGGAEEREARPSRSLAAAAPADSGLLSLRRFGGP